MRRTLFLTAVLITAVLPGLVSAQKILVSKFIDLPAAKARYAFLAAEEGEIISKNGIKVDFMMERSTNNTLTGYRYEKNGCDKLQSGDRIMLFIPDLAYAMSIVGGTKDASDAIVSFALDEPSLKGAFKPITIGSVKIVEKSLEIEFPEKVVLRDKTELKKIKLHEVDGWYVVDRSVEAK